MKKLFLDKNKTLLMRGIIILLAFVSIAGGFLQGVSLLSVRPINSKTSLPFHKVPLQVRGTASLPTSANELVSNSVPTPNPLIGTDQGNSPDPVPNGAGGATFPGADVPFGMVQWSPDTTNSGPGGYAYSSNQITDFSLTHFNGAGCSNNQDIPITPTVGLGNTNTTIGFSHGDEAIDAGYYSVMLANKVKTKLTVTQRTGFGRFTFPVTNNANIVIDASHAANAVKDPRIDISGSREVSGQETSGHFCGAGNTYTIYFDAQFDHDFTASNPSPGKALLTFNTASNPVVQMRIGISYVSVANARGNLAAENPNWDFDGVRTQARTTWNTYLSRIRVSGSSRVNLSEFYTALYHTLLQPNVFSDTNGQYMGFDKQVHTASGYTQYANFSGWDIYRSEIPLLALFYTHQANDIMKSFVADAQQCGAFPMWAQNSSDVGIMGGDPDSISVVNGYTFGATNFDTSTALSVMMKSATEGANCAGSAIRGGLKQYLEHGYLTFDNAADNGPTSATLEYTSADFAIAQFAKARGDRNSYSLLMQHSGYWQNEFNANTGYIEPRNSDGSWKSNFDPTSNDGYTEGNAAQYSWMVPYDLHDLFNKMGGNLKVVSRLDTYFSQLNAGLSLPNFYIGNEPDFADPWLYDWAQAPSHTQKVVHDILSQVFTPDPGGLPGNDDLGAMSSWFIFGALGIYPEVPGVPGFALASPMFSTSVLTLGNGKTVTINASGSPGAYYIQRMAINGKPYDSSWLPLNALNGGATINYALGTSASTWASAPNEVPPSYGPEAFQR